MNFGKAISLLKDKVKTIQQTKETNTKFRVRGINRVIDKIESKYTPKTRVSKAKLEALGLTKHMTHIILDLKKNSNEANQQGSQGAKKEIDYDALQNDLVNFMGIGKTKAKELIKDGLKHINQLRRKKWADKLNKDTIAFLKFKPERKIPREIIDELSKKLTIKNATIVGSYRRGKSFSRDVDVLVATEKPIEKIIDKYKKLFGTFVPYSMGQDKASFLLKHDGKYYKVDVFLVSHAECIPMLLYSTGSKAHNIIMRSNAKKLGMRLNQKGLFKVKEDGSLDKITGLKSEEDYFKKLGMKYKPPNERM